MPNTKRDDKGLLPWELHHNDVMYWKKETKLYFDERGHQVSCAQFVRRQSILDTHETHLQTGM